MLRPMKGILGYGLGDDPLPAEQVDLSASGYPPPISYGVVTPPPVGFDYTNQPALQVATPAQTAGSDGGGFSWNDLLSPAAPTPSFTQGPSKPLVHPTNQNVPGARQFSASIVVAVYHGHPEGI